MKWVRRILWFAAGAVTLAVVYLAIYVYRDITNAEVTVDVTNSTNQSAGVKLAGDGAKLDLGRIAPNGRVMKYLTIGDFGEGPMTLIVDGSIHHEYPLGIALTGKGTYERFISLTPKGVVGFFYSPSKDSWCGLLEEGSP